MEALKNCIFARVWRYVALGAHGWYEESVLGRICCRISKHYESSRMKAIFDRFVSKNSSVYTSLYSSILAFISSLIVKSGDRLMPLIRQSLIYKALNYIASFILRVWSGSFLGKLSSRIGFTFKRFIIVLAALYLPLDYFIRRYIPSLASVWDELFFCAVVMYILCRIFSRRQRNAPNGEKTRATPLDIPIFLFIAVSFCLMCLNSPIMSIAIDGFRATVQYMLWFYVMLRLLDDEKDCVYLEITTAVVGLMMSLHGIYQYIVAAPIPAGWVSQTEQGVRSRAFSITGSPNILGCYIVMTVPIFAGLAYRFKSYITKVIMWAAVILECLCVLVTFSRG
ncbi:MAG: hypothetical protein GX633_03450, partial [Clostridiales bacterium]|nr:hypothetical protein [Clostridiales bacterium]